MADDSGECVGEVLKRIEAKLAGDVRDGGFALQQKLFRPLDPAFDLVADRRETGCLAELVDEMRGRKCRLARKGVDREGAFRMGADEVDDLCNTLGTASVGRLFRQLEEQYKEREHDLAHLHRRPGQDWLVAKLEKAREEFANLPGANPCRNRRGEVPKTFPDGGGLVAGKVDQRPVCYRFPYEEIVDVEAVRARSETVRDIRLVDEEAARHDGELVFADFQGKGTA